MNQPQSALQAIFGGLGATELILILLIVLLVFGAGKLPQIGEALGKSIKNFKAATNKAKDEVEVTPKAIEDKDKAARTVDVEAPSEKKNA